MNKNKNKNLNKRNRRYTMVINNPQDNGLTHECIFNILDKCDYQYICMGDEIGDNGTYHTHVYVAYTNARTFENMKNDFPTAHIEVAYGSSLENRNYFLKEGSEKNEAKAHTRVECTFEEFGQIPQEPELKLKRSELLYQLVSKGLTTEQIIEENPQFSLNIKTIDELVSRHKEKDGNKRRVDILVEYIYGKPGVGKTRYVMDKYGDDNVFIVHLDNKSFPFDGYDGEDVVLFDDFYGQLSLDDMLRYLDIYKLSLNVKGSHRKAIYTKAYITSNIPLVDQYKDCKEKDKLIAFQRRIKNYYICNKDGLYPKSKDFR